jgi:hypothetical protein
MTITIDVLSLIQEQNRKQEARTDFASDVSAGLGGKKSSSHSNIFTTMQGPSCLSRYASSKNIILPGLRLPY